MRFRHFGLFLAGVFGCRAQEQALTQASEITAALSISAPQTVRVGERITFDVQLTNEGTSAIVLPAGDKHIFTDFHRSETDSLVYSIPAAVQTAELVNTTVAPGATLRVTRWWDFRNGRSDFVAPGTYRIRAWASLPAGNPRVRVESSPVTFALTR